MNAAKKSSRYQLSTPEDIFLGANMPMESIGFVPKKNCEISRFRLFIRQKQVKSEKM
jgi:hypothetical protein